MLFEEPEYSKEFLEWWWSPRHEPKFLDAKEANNEYLVGKIGAWLTWQAAYLEGWAARGRADQEAAWKALEDNDLGVNVKRPVQLAISQTKLEEVEE